MRANLLRLAGVLAALVVMAGFAAGIAAMVRDVRDEIDALATANSDSAQWSMAQLDVEFLAFQLELRTLQAGAGDPARLRRRFDVFYGRIRLMETSRLYDPLRGREDFEVAMASVWHFLNQVTPLIDGPDAALVGALGRMASDADALRPVLRNLTLSGQRAMAVSSDLRRREAGATLVRVAVVTLVLVMVLAAMVVVLARLVRQTRMRAAEQALTHGRLRAIIATSQDAILVVDARGQVLESNAAAEELFGIARHQIEGRRVDTLICRRDALADDADRLPPAGARLTRIEGRRGDGSRFPAEISVGETGSEDGPIRVCFLHDISDRLSAEQALVEARDRALAGEKSNAEMLALMSHEIRTPLNGILGTLDLLQETRLTARQRDYLRVVRNSGDLLLQHVNDVLDIARLDAGKMPVAHEPFDLAALLDSVADSQRPAAARQGNRLAVAPGAPGLVLGDALKLRQVLLNLIGNAVKFTRDGEITLSARRLGDGTVAVTVADTGIGIAEGDLGRIFDDFVTLDSSYGRRAEGTGLGLPIARRMVRAMGGTIDVESQEGHGSRFRLTLPLPPTSADSLPLPPAAPTAAPAVPLPRMRILVVEDNPINRFVVRQLLEDDGHRVDEATSGTEGVARAGKQCYDLILMDIGMPELDGVAATRAIRSGTGASRHAPIIALTAHALPEDLARFTEAGMNGTLVKPLSRGALRDILAGTARPPAPKASPDSIDQARANALIERLGPETFGDLLHRYLTETGEGLAELADASRKNDLAAMSARAHLLAGSAAVFGASGLRGHLVALDTAARQGQGDRARERLARAQAIWPETRAAFRALAETAQGTITPPPAPPPA
ncbi:ATP-binding protein [Gemmobacter nectariphilus]|uniref:ATP-binding protein n=1 Tax=Gemmobacter nectariphilus TaxID=220343 RepID=UPI00040E3E46|nr:ATP-binding protein [Gemmobacter nectariphilus]